MIGLVLCLVGGLSENFEKSGEGKDLLIGKLAGACKI